MLLNPLAKRSTSVEQTTAVVTERPYQRSDVPYVLLTIFLLGTGVVIAGGMVGPGYHTAFALLWAFGCCVSGMLLGFLFAIPRVLPAGSIVAPASPVSPAGEAGNAGDGDSAGAVASTTTPVSSEINSNLVEVSDWLTKIIVGVGLVNLQNFPEYAAGVAAFVAPGLGMDTGTGAQVAAAISLFFSVLGFLIGYLLTRIFLAVIIKQADTQVQYIRLESGRRVGVGELTRLQQASLKDLQRTMAEIVSGMADGKRIEENVAATRRPPYRILWVDDKPANNVLIAEQLRNQGVSIREVLSTQEGLAALAEGGFDLAISDMSRTEGGVKIRDAGLRFVREARAMQPDLPVYIFCGRNGVADYGVSARTAGAALVTDSETRLIAEITKALGLKP
ncbi:hypothetical protein [Massilia sp. SYSU DXS3249]